MNLGSAVLDHHHPPQVEENSLNSELWHACAGPLVSLPAVGSHVVYFPQGHSEQVAVSTNKEVDGQIPNYPSLPPQLICQLHDVTMHADVETDEVYAQMTLQPLTSQEQKEISFHPADLGVPSKQPTNYFCKTLTASDTSTHGGFSVPRRAAEKVFPSLDFSQQPPAQELIARDLHNNEWKFRHIFRGQPKRHLLTTGWSIFVNAKRLVAGDSVLFIWNEKNQLLLGIRRANRTQTVMPSSVLSSDSMHHGLLAAAAHAAATNSRFTIFYNPRASPSEFVIPLAKYVKTVYHTRVSVGMRFRMLFETEESSVRRYMGTITGIGDSVPARWPNSHWRSVKVGWDESTAGEKQPRVSLWEIEPLTTFPMYPSPFPMRLKRPWPHGLPPYMGIKNEDMGLNSPLMWLQGDHFYKQGFGVSPFLMQQQQQQRFDPSMLMQNEIYQAMAASALQEMRALDPSRHILPQATQLHQSHILGQPQMLQQSHPQTQPPQLHDNVLLMHPNQYIAEPHQLSPLGNTVQPHMSPSFQPQMVQNILEPNAKAVSSLQSLLGDDMVRTSNSLGTNNGWPTKRAAIDPMISGGGVPQGLSNPLGSLNENVTQNPNHSMSNNLPPFPGRTCLNDPEGSHDPQTNFLFGINNDNAADTFASTSSYVSTSGVDYSLDNPLVASSDCIDDSGLLHANPHNGTFVKVYKSKSYGRSLDITKFSSYDELRSALAQMFGLEGQLEDHLRSGWQLVFVDRENDVLLLGDDPWQEFVNNVWCIKILSPQEVHDMGKKQGMKLANPISIPRLGIQNGSCDDGMSRHELRNMNSGILPSVAATLDF